MLPRNLAVADAPSAVAAQGEEQKGAELGNHGTGEQARRLLDVQQEAIGNGVGQAAAGPPFVAEPVGVQNEEKDTEAAGELHDAFERPQIIFLLHGRGILRGKNTLACCGSGFDVRSSPSLSVPYKERSGR